MIRTSLYDVAKDHEKYSTSCVQSDDDSGSNDQYYHHSDLLIPNFCGHAPVSPPSPSGLIMSAAFSFGSKCSTSTPGNCETSTLSSEKSDVTLSEKRDSLQHHLPKTKPSSCLDMAMILFRTCHGGLFAITCKPRVLRYSLFSVVIIKWGT